MSIQKLLWCATLLSFLIFGCDVSAQTPATPGLSGQWEGMVSVRGNWRYLEADFGEDAGSGLVKIDLPQQRRRPVIWGMPYTRCSRSALALLTLIVWC